MTIGSGIYFNTQRHNTVIDHTAGSIPADITSPAFINSIQKVKLMDDSPAAYANLKEKNLDPIDGTGLIFSDGVTKDEFMSFRPFKLTASHEPISGQKILNIEPLYLSEAKYPFASDYYEQSPENTFAPDAYTYTPIDYGNTESRNSILASAIPRHEAYDLAAHFPTSMQERITLPSVPAMDQTD